MLKNRLPLVTAFLLIFAYSCKKSANDPRAEQDPILTISNGISSGRVDLTNTGEIVNFSTESAGSTRAVEAPVVYPFELEYNGKIDVMKDANNTRLTAIDVTAYGNGIYGVTYMTPGENYSGGVDIFRILPSKAPQLFSSIIADNADINQIKIGGGRVFLGLDLKNYESMSNLESPAVVGIVDISNNSLSNPQYVGLKGFSVKDLHYSANNNKLYAASADNGGLSVISFNNGLASRSGFAFYGGLRAITVSGNELIGSNAYAYSTFSSSTGELNISSRKEWPVRSNETQLGAMKALPNGNFLFGNNFALIHVDKNTNTLIDQVDVGGWIYSISVVSNKIYIAAGNSILVAVVDNGHLKIIARTHFKNTFGGGNFVINNVTVDSDKVVVTCGKQGTYVFTLKQK